MRTCIIITKPQQYLDIFKHYKGSLAHLIVDDVYEFMEPYIERYGKAVVHENFFGSYVWSSSFTGEKLRLEEADRVICYNQWLKERDNEAT